MRTPSRLLLMMPLTKANSGELPRAFVVLSAGAQKRVSGNAEASKKLQKDIADHVANKVVKYKALTGGVEFIEYVNVLKLVFSAHSLSSVIPVNPSGKLLR